MRDPNVEKDEVEQISQIKKDVHPMRRTTSEFLPKEYEVAIKRTGDTFQEDYFVKPVDQKISKSKIVVSSLKLSLIYIKFQDLEFCLYPYPAFRKIFEDACRTGQSHARHYKQIEDYKKAFKGYENKTLDDIKPRNYQMDIRETNKNNLNNQVLTKPSMLMMKM